MDSITYITYQTFPAFTANSIQTITHIKYFARLGLNVTLVFPLRNKESDSNLQKLKSFYQISDNFNSEGTKHFLPFKKIKIFEKYSYILSHFLWAFFVTRKYKNKHMKNYFTRSEWVFYFMSRKNHKIIFECHQISKLKKILIKKSLDKDNSKLILLTESMKNEIGQVDSSKVMILSSSYDEEIFSYKKDIEKEEKIIYTGSFYRFGESRGIQNLNDSFKRLSKEGVDTILVSNDAEKIYENTNFSHDGFTLFSNLNRREISEILERCKVGLLINNESHHAEKYTSPLKYFEYISMGLNVVATKNEAHTKLPYQDKIYYFDKNNNVSFLNAVRAALKAETSIPDDLKMYSMGSRVNHILNFYK